MHNTPFAEIEIETDKDRRSAGGTELRSFEPVSSHCIQDPGLQSANDSGARFFTAMKPQPIKPRIIDPIREKFYEMRRLASERPFAGSDSELFYRQAKFMEDFTDTYEGNANFNMYYPYYQNMGYEYLRSYFSWRTKIRNGEVTETSLSYIFLYIYELLSGIGIKDNSDGLDRLLLIWDAFSGENPALKKYLPKWLKDYHIFYELPHSFSDFIEKYKMQKHYSLVLLFDRKVENRLELWNSISGYDITNSKFYKEGNEQLLSDCFDTVYNEIQAFCSVRNTRFEDLLVYSVSRKSPWQPFKQALFGSRARQTDREINISGFERYRCKNGQWTASVPIYYSSQKDFVGYVLKKTEACLRQEVKYKYKLVADIKPGSKPFRELQRPAAKRAELDKVIGKAVADFHKALTRTVVRVNHSNLARIRKEALGTQAQLIVPEEAPFGTIAAMPDKPGISPTRQPQEQTQTKDQTQTQKQPQEQVKLTMSFSDGWKALKEALTETERGALKIVLDYSSDIKAFADENGIMLEVLADSINEKAADCIGDSLLELGDDIMLYDEYRDNVAGLITGEGNK